MIRGLLSYDSERDTLKPTKLLFMNYFSNMLGAIVIFTIVIACNMDCSTLIDLAVIKCKESLSILIARGFACNVLVCLAVWIGVYLEQTYSKLERFISVIFPVIAFVACGFEHSVANMFILPFGLFAGEIDILQLIIQLFSVTIGNWLGGIFLGALLSETMREG